MLASGVIVESPGENETVETSRLRLSRRRLLEKATRTACTLAIAPTVARLAGGCEVAGSAGVARADETSVRSTPATGASPQPTPASSVAPATSAEVVPTETARLLRDSEFVYISSTRKDGTLSRKAEIWFTWQDGSVWVGTRPDSWRAKRIRWKRPMATIWVGSPDGPSIRARGEFVSDPARFDMLCRDYSAKYPARWPRWEASFREGLANGERVLIRYVPVAEPAAS